MKVYVIIFDCAKRGCNRFVEVFRSREGAEEYMKQGDLSKSYYKITEKEVMDSEV
jgi:hypothetical protein